MFKMKNVLAISAVLLLTACSSDNDSPGFESTDPRVPETSMLRVVHASPDAPKVDILAGGAILNGLENVDYQVASGVFTVNATVYPVTVNAKTPSGVVEVLSASLTANADALTSVIAVGSVADNTLEILALATMPDMSVSGTTQLQVVHAAPLAPTVDIHVTAPDVTTLSSATVLATAAYKDATGLVSVASGDYRIRITPAGSDTVVFDSGTVALASEEMLLIAATQNVGPGDSPVSLVVAGKTGAVTILDVNTPADLRVIHAVADAPAVDVIANNALTLFDGAPFLGVTDYASVTADTYLVDVVADADNSVVVIDDASVTLEAGKTYTAIAHNTLADIGLDLVMDMPRRVATEAQVRIFHASPAAGSVDIYVTADGVITDATPAFSGVPFSSGMLAETGYVALTAGDYHVTVTPTGTKDIALETGMLTLSANMIYTALAVDAVDGGGPVQLILADDF
ncbi:MAG TPA: DUF4397 domain-containing protein [Glaciecola sp.]|jgi:hypothetical protein|nr:DUF4397 domain-containing protein [Glaciecola sp.]